MTDEFLTALPVFNEVDTVDGVLEQVRLYSRNVLVVDDGSTDGTARRLSRRRDIILLRHDENRGYGAALSTAFRYAIDEGYPTLVTIDCDGQHEPQRIPGFVDACTNVDIVSGSRYLKHFPHDSEPPAQRRRINEQITAQLNRRLGLKITDAFCGFKAYRVKSLEMLELTVDGYAMPLELWVQAARLGLAIVELPVPLIYLDEHRSFGGALDDAETRMNYYQVVLDRSIAVADAIQFGPSANARCGERT